jgi:hypothetical protein
MDITDITDCADCADADARRDTVRFEPCAGYRPADHDDEVCACGWLEADHDELATARAARRRRRPGAEPVSVLVRRAS